MDHSYDTPQPSDIYVGAAFTSLADFQFALSQYMHETCTVYNIAKSQRLQTTPLFSPTGKIIRRTKPLPPELKYQHATYGCKHFGTVRSSGRGIRPNQKTFKTGCPSHIILCVDRERSKLVVKSAVFEHNHRLGPEVARLYPENRVVKGVRGEKKLMRIKNLPRDTKLLQGIVQPSVHYRIGNVPWVFQDVKDKVTIESVSPGGEECSNPQVSSSVEQSLSRLQSRSDSPNGSARFVDLEDFVGLLTKDHGCQVDVYKRDEEFHGLFFQDNTMKQCYATFPEYLCFDCSNTLLFSQASVFLLAIEDTIGKAEIVGVGILSSDDDAAIDWLLATFKNNNEDCSRVKVVLSNGVENHVKAFEKHLPTSRHLINPSYCLKVWKYDVPRGEAGVTEDGKDFAHILLQRALLAESATVYEQVYSEMKSALSPDIKRYYFRNWHSIKEKWVLGITYQSNFMASAAKIVELMIRKLGLKTTSITNISKFLQRMFFELQVQRTDRNKACASLIYKIPVQQVCLDSGLAEYSTILTSYALSFVVKEFESIDNCKPLDYMNSQPSTSGSIVIQVDSCCCPFYEVITLPCCHIFVRRRFLGLPLFDICLCTERWTKEFNLNKNNQRLTEEMATNEALDFLNLSRCTEVTSELRTLLANSSGKMLNERLELLETLIKHWRQGDDIAIMDHRSIEKECVETYETREVFDSLGTNVNVYTKVPQDSEMQEVEHANMFVADEVEVVFFQSDIEHDVIPKKRTIHFAENSLEN